MDSETKIERMALAQALRQFIMETRPQVSPSEVEILIGEVLILYDELVGSGLHPAKASQILIRQAARAAAATEQQNLN